MANIPKWHTYINGNQSSYPPFTKPLQRALKLKTLTSSGWMWKNGISNKIEKKLILHTYIVYKSVQHVLIGNKAQKVGGEEERKKTSCNTDSFHDEKELLHEIRCCVLYSQKQSKISHLLGMREDVLNTRKSVCFANVGLPFSIQSKEAACLVLQHKKCYKSIFGNEIICLNYYWVDAISLVVQKHFAKILSYAYKITL